MDDLVVGITCRSQSDTGLDRIDRRCATREAMPVRDVAARATVRRAFAVCVDRGFTRIAAVDQQPLLDVADIHRPPPPLFCGFSTPLPLVFPLHPLHLPFSFSPFFQSVP